MPNSIPLMCLTGFSSPRRGRSAGDCMCRRAASAIGLAGIRLTRSMFRAICSRAAATGRVGDRVSERSVPRWGQWPHLDGLRFASPIGLAGIRLTRSMFRAICSRAAATGRAGDRVSERSVPRWGQWPHPDGLRFASPIGPAGIRLTRSMFRAICSSRGGSATIKTALRSCCYGVFATIYTALARQVTPFFSMRYTSFAGA